MTDDRAGAHDVPLHLLVLRCQAGDERAFARLIDGFGAKTHRYLRGLVGDDADDVQQEVWLTVYRSLHTLSNPAAFRTWLFRTTRHRAVDCLRRRKRERELIDDVPIERLTVADTDEERLDGIDVAAMDAVLESIPPPQREVLLLRYRDDLSYADIASVVGCPIGTVRTRLHHAKRRLYELLHRDDT